MWLKSSWLHNAKPITNIVIVLCSFSKDPLILVSVLMTLCVLDKVTANSRIFRVFAWFPNCTCYWRMFPRLVRVLILWLYLVFSGHCVAITDFLFKQDTLFKLVLPHTQVALQKTGRSRFLFDSSCFIPLNSVSIVVYVAYITLHLSSCNGFGKPGDE